MEYILNIVNMYSACLFCGNHISSKYNIKFCADCCKTILYIDDNLKRIIENNNKPRGTVLEKRLGIKSRKDFKCWAVYNHPDKGGNSEIFRKVSQLVDKKYPK